MDLIVKNVKLANHQIETPDQDNLRRYPCPICGGTEHLQSIGEVHAAGQTSLESAFCRHCEHRFHAKFPAPEWLQDYYRVKFESSRGGPAISPTEPIQHPGLYRRARLRLGTLLRYGLSGTRPNRIHDFCLGVTKADAWYFKVNSGIRKILEIGCGTGANLRYFADRGFDTYGTESNPVRVADCRRQGLRVFPTGIEGFQEVEQYAPFDFIYSSHVLEHVIDIDSHIRQLAGLVRPGGFVYIETPDLSGETFIQQTHTIFHVHTFSLSSMLRLLANNGLEAVRVLADNNLQVLAQKLDIADKPGVQLSGRVYRDRSEKWLSEMAKFSPAEFKIMWDHHRVRVERMPGTVVYDQNLTAFAVSRGPNQHEMHCIVPDGAGLSGLYPVRFHHEGLVKPPIWYKN